MSPVQAAGGDVVRSALFGTVAISAGWVPPLRYLLRRRRIMRLLSPLPAGRLVEVGCGGGALLDELSAMGHQAVGVESSPRALAVASALAEATGGRQRLLAAPDPDWDRQVDLVCSFDVLEHIENDRQALDEWLSWLRPGGLLCLSVPAHRHRWSAGDEWAGHYRRYDREDFLGLLSGRGLRIEHLECYGFPVANLTEWLGARTYRRLLAERDAGVSRREATAGSGVDRRDSKALFRWLDSWPGRACLRLALGSQALFARTDLGSGYLVLARKL
ncbi:class I SAM-dependent methyltransferase [Arenimonas daejeonensis]|uniref:class I SAM-dependent methyltransferase n=1 Tax=Arenimonas daejeonensis TaxID=370777 RepID=UPI0011BF6106|nr:class I SAM-dependent methyltransferase [Arenimonas daejeonensis]